MRRRSWIRDLDWITLGIYFMLVVAGWFAIYAALYDGVNADPFDFSRSYGKQLIWIGVSMVVGITILIIDSKFYTTFAYVIYGLVMLSLVAVLFFGQTIKGSTSWFVIGGFSIQPAEFAKFATCLALAKFLSGLNVSMRTIGARLFSAGIMLLPVGLILLQGDTGSALVFFSLVFVLYREGLPSWFMLLGIAIAVIAVLALLINKVLLIALIVLGAGVMGYLLRKSTSTVFPIVAIAILSIGLVLSVDYAFNNILRSHQKERINVLLGKEMDLRGAGYNVHQSKIAIGSGGFSGKGFLQGTQTKFNFVPEQSTDFIFCTIGEERGFIGSLFVLGTFLLLLWRLIYVSERQRSKFTRIYGYGVASILFFHVAINIGMTIGLVPVIGIPLPLISYGGSSIIAFTILIFIFLKLDADRLAVLR